MDYELGDMVADGKKRLQRWLAAGQRMNRLKKEMTSLQNELTDAENDLGEWLCPEDAKIGESFCIWYGDSLIQATKKLKMYGVVIRKRGKSMSGAV